LTLSFKSKKKRSTTTYKQLMPKNISRMRMVRRDLDLGRKEGLRGRRLQEVGKGVRAMPERSQVDRQAREKRRVAGQRAAVPHSLIRA
jgi:hypothetical protein